ncbi:hypothetical protein [Pigmentibacter ruber]|uniref:hypothetical protein n=1 Tax=Pigmentibacter ruber TaxID=2683196 RepID=UPI00131AECD9|nr:hypothetical protein [Pigmentibacter ruber]
MTESKIDKQTKYLAAVAYGEAGVNYNIKEITGIAYAVMNRLRAWNKYLVAKNKKPLTIIQLFEEDKKYAFATNGKNVRFNLFQETSDDKIISDPIFSKVLEAANNAINCTGIDYSNGAFWWDGKDIFSKYKSHPKVKVGIKFTDPSHNIYKIKETPKGYIRYVTHIKINKKTKKEEEKKTEIGRHDYIFNSTAAHGETIFWKTDPDYVKLAKALAFR